MLGVFDRGAQPDALSAELASRLRVQHAAAPPPSSATSLEKLRVPELRDRLRELDLPVSGRKAELVERLRNLLHFDVLKAGEKLYVNHFLVVAPDLGGWQRHHCYA